MYQFFKHFLFAFPPEKAHKLSLSLFRICLKIPLLSSAIRGLFHYENQKLENELWGLKFINPVGLAAGFDKDGQYPDIMSQLGFGFIELGTVTPKSQIGNPHPRLFRLQKDRALINRMGFNNDGVDALVERLKTFERGNLIIGGNIGKNKDTPNEKAIDDYLVCFDKLHSLVDYFVVNVSSPNTPNLRELQEKEPLKDLLLAIQERNHTKSIHRPVLLKIAPDLSRGQIDDILEVIEEAKIDGIVATNTTIERKGLRSLPSTLEAIGMGGLSGAPIKNKSTEVIRYIHQQTKGSLPIIAVGGIHDSVGAIEKIKAGASLIQIYTGLIYEGPALIKRIKKALAKPPI